MENTALVPAYASFGRRAVAIGLDGLVMVIPCVVANAIIPYVGGVILALLYSPMLESSALRATIGKRTMGIQVATLSGERIIFSAALIRYFMKGVSALLFGLGFLLALFTRHKQALHDLVAETVVVNGLSDQNLVNAWLAQVKAVFGRIGGEITRTDLSVDQLSSLERLQGLREKGTLTEEEFQAQKKRILGRDL